MKLRLVLYTQTHGDREGAGERRERERGHICILMKNDPAEREH